LWNERMMLFIGKENDENEQRTMNEK